MLVVGLALAALLGAFAVERILARGIATGTLARPELHMSIEIAQPLDLVWAYASNIERQPEWMHEMKRVEMLTPPPVAPGSRGRATVRIFGISTTDDVVDRKSTRLNSSHSQQSRMPSSA